MMKNIFLTFLIIFLSSISFAQEMDQYQVLVKDAYDLYSAKEYVASSKKYEEAFVSIGGKAVPSDRYNASCSHALAGNVDTSFYHLFRLANTISKYQNYLHITNDSDLVILHNDNRWEKLIAIVKANKEYAERNLDKELVEMLRVIHEEDQKYRVALDTIEEKFSWDSDEVQAQWQIIHEKDSLNLIEVRKILDERGWLGSNIVGEQGNGALFLVIQHADIKTQEKYLPMMKEAVKKGNAQASSLALLEDRVALRQGKKQIYGSQVWKLDGKWYVRSLEDPENVDIRRAEVGLGPLNEYTQYFGFDWDLEGYYETLPEQEEQLKK